MLFKLIMKETSIALRSLVTASSCARTELSEVDDELTDTLNAMPPPLLDGRPSLEVEGVGEFGRATAAAFFGFTRGDFIVFLLDAIDFFEDFSSAFELFFMLCFRTLFLGCLSVATGGDRKLYVAGKTSAAVLKMGSITCAIDCCSSPGD
jgi:hypothetical protein